MTPGTRVRHIKSGKQGTVRWTMGAVCFVRWDDPLTSGPAEENLLLLEVVE